jgi:hypothetical protein
MRADHSKYYFNPLPSKQNLVPLGLTLFYVSLRLSAGKALDFNSRVTGNSVEFLALAE